MTLATGGTETTVTIDGTVYKIHTFNTSGTLTVSEGGQVEYLVIAGGGGGGSYTVSGDGGGGGAGGGGGGGVLYGTEYSVNADTTIPVTIGAGGAVAGNGVNSLFGTATAIGGGRGAFFVEWNSGQVGASGGSGGGGSGNYFQGFAGGAGTPGQGNTGGAGITWSTNYRGGGGGGAGAPGGNAVGQAAGNGGDGASSSITGSSIFYAGGGGGGTIQEGSATSGGDGGLGGGGLGIRERSPARTPTAGTGGSGGGGGAGAAGGAGVVIVRYAFSEPVVVQDTVAASGGTETTITVNNKVYRVHTFNTSGTLTVSNGGEFEYLIVAGGGGAPVSGDGNAGNGAGGGGGVLSGNVVFNTGSTIAVTVGAGGVNSNGSNSSLINLPAAIGGGRGGVFATAGLAGGSGGGGGGRLDAGGGAGTAGQGNNGGAARSGDTGGQSAGGGGGGAGAAGSKGGSAIGGKGGDGATSLITNVLRYYGGGGGGMANGTGGAGGLGGGGIGVSSGGSGTYAAGGAGGVNTGGGSGGGNAGGTGGSGIVILRYVFVEPVLEPEIITVAGGEGGVGGPFAGGGGGAAGYVPPPPTSAQDILQNRDVLAITANGINTEQNNTFVDSSSNNLTITRFGNVAQGSFSPYSPAGWSGHFDGSGDYLSIPANSAFAFGTGDYTIEFYLYPNNSADFTIVDSQGSGGNAQISRIGGVFYHGGIPSWNYTFTNNVWTHIAFSRSGTDLRLFANGVLIETKTNSNTVGSSTNVFEIGRRIDGFYPLNGYISNLRVVKGTAVYTAAFTPPTEPLTAIANTSLLTCMDNRFVDRSANNFSITRNGDARTIVFSPLLPTTIYGPTIHGGSAYFDGTGDYLTLPFSATTAQWWDADYTIEMWINNTVNAQSSVNGLPLQVAYGTPSSDATFWAFGTNVSGNLYFYYYNGVAVTNAVSTAVVPLNSWNHVAMVYTNSNTTLTGYINGVQAFSVARSGTPQAPSSGYTLNIGVTQNVGYRGYISNLRVVKGTAIYTANFTPPTAPVTAIANTSLLMNFTNAAIVDASGKNNIETLNGAQVSTSVTKYGSGSVSFDGVDDRLVIANNPNLILAGGPWTVECWIYFTGNYSNYRAIFCKRVGVTATTSYQGYIQQTSGLLSFFNGVEYVSTAQVTANLWHHCAWVYTGTNIEIYFNGVRVLNAAATITEVDTPVRIGSLDGNLEQYVGYIDDFRITKGVARYNAAFTPPNEIYLPPPTNKLGFGASGSALQAGEDNSLDGGAGGGSSSTAAGGGGGTDIDGIILETIDLTNSATGGVKSTVIVNSEEYIVHTFASSGSLVCATSISAIEYLVIAGGGSGGGGTYNSGGGGAGGMRTGSVVIAPGTYSIVVGAGAAGTVNHGADGGASSALGFAAVGGGGGGQHPGGTSQNGNSGGSGGGGSQDSGTGGAGTAGQGNNGGGNWYAAGAGGGGAGAAGAVGPGGTTVATQAQVSGGIGLQSSITGTSVYYAGGGGGGRRDQYGIPQGLGGTGGGGNGGLDPGNGFAGTANTGGGGGGSGGNNTNTRSGGNGGSGIVIIRYPRFGFGAVRALGGAVGQGGAGANGGLAGVNGNGGLYGGGGGGTTNSTVNPAVGNGAGGALKIVWPAVREYPFPNEFPTTVTNVITGSLQTTTVRIDTPAQTIPMVTTTVPVTESLSWVNNASSVYEIGTTVTYDPKFSVDSPRPVPLSPFVSTKELQILVTEIDHELMLVNNDAKNLATWDNPTRYEKIERVTLENDPRRITVRLLNFVIGVTGEGALVPTQIQTWF